MVFIAMLAVHVLQKRIRRIKGMAKLHYSPQLNIHGAL